MKLFLFLFYETAKILVWIVRWFYYARRDLVNSKLRDYKGPCILVSNHPGTLMDPLNVAVLMKRRVNFLANASLFATPFSHWFFSTFYCIKVERHKDTGGKPLQNEEAFEMAADYLTNGGCLYMAPEGGSHSGRQLNKLKTGTARIALNTEAANDFKLGLAILPVGLNYSDPGQFRSKLLTVMGEPVMVADFKEDWQEDQLEAVRKLTGFLRERMVATLINTSDEEEDLLLSKVETIMQNDVPLNGASLMDRSKRVLEKIQNWRTDKTAFYQSFKDKTDAYFQKLTSLETLDLSVKGGQIPYILMIIGLPIFALGFIIHFLPAYFTQKLCDRLSTDPSWVPTFKVLGGLIIYPMTLFLQFWLLTKSISFFWETADWWKWVYMALIIPSGLVAEWFLAKYQLLLSNRRYRLFAENHPEEAASVVQMREDIRKAVV